MRVRFCDVVPGVHRLEVKELRAIEKRAFGLNGDDDGLTLLGLMRDMLPS